MDMITREVRMAGYNTNGGLTFDGIIYDTTEIRVQANLDGDADTGDADEDIIYAYDSVDARARSGLGFAWYQTPRTQLKS